MEVSFAGASFFSGQRIPGPSSPRGMPAVSLMTETMSIAEFAFIRHQTLIFLAPGFDCELAAGRARYGDLDPQAFRGHALLDLVGPFNEADALALEILVHTKIKKLFHRFEPIGIEMIDRDAGRILVNKNERGAGDHPRIGNVQSQGHGADQMRFARSQGSHQANDRARKKASPEPLAEFAGAGLVVDNNNIPFRHMLT
jgi:hypothetical protein